VIGCLVVGILVLLLFANVPVILWPVLIVALIVLGVLAAVFGVVGGLLGAFKGVLDGLFGRRQ
jgi:hypothetical protein